MQGRLSLEGKARKGAPVALGVVMQELNDLGAENRRK